jgi:hypothetical protein
MNRLLSVLIAAAFASISAGALAADGVEGVRDQAKATYKMDKKGCDPLQGEERKNCLHRAKAQYNQARTEARKMKAEQKEEKTAKRAEARDTKRRARGAEPAPAGGMGKAPVTAGGSPSN